MAGFVDVVLRGLILVLTSVALGGVVWLRVVLRAEPYVKPDVPIAVALRAIAVAAAGAALAQAAIALVGLGATAHAHGTWPVAAFFETTFALTATARVMLAATVAVLAAAMTRRAASGAMWTAFMAAATVLVASSAIVSHAVARVEWRAALVALDAAHQLAVAVWVGGLAHLTLYTIADERSGVTEPLVVAGTASSGRTEGGLFKVPRGSDTPDFTSLNTSTTINRFSALAFRSMAVIVVAGLALTLAYVGDPGALVGTAYGVMVLSKIALLVPALALAYVNMRAVRRASAAPDVRLFS